MKTTAVQSTTHGATRGTLLALGLSMSGQLLVAVLLPVLGGVALDKKTGHAAGSVWTIVGLVIALVASGLVIWGAAKRADAMPKTKLSAAARAAVQKRIAEDDAEDDK